MRLRSSLITGMLFSVSVLSVSAQSTSPLYCPWPTNNTTTCVAPATTSPTTTTTYVAPKATYVAPKTVADPTKCPGGTGKVWPDHTNDANAEFLAKCGVVVRQTDTKLYRFADKILRQEVVGMADKIRGLLLPGNYTCKNYFGDVMQNSPNSWVCRASEVAADYSMVTRANGIFRPEDNVTKSEGLAMMLSAVCLQPVTQDQVDTLMTNNTKFAADAVDWQKKVMVKYNSIKAFSYTDFAPNACATRSELFDFAVNVLNYTAANGQCYSTICDQLRNTAINVIPANSVIYTIKTVDQAVTQLRALGGDFAQVSDEKTFISTLQKQFPFLDSVDSYREFMQYVENDPYLATATSMDQLVTMLGDYTFFSEEIGTLPGFSAFDDTDEFIREVRKIPGFSDVENLGSFIQTLNNYPGFETVRNVDDLIDVLGDFESFGDFSDAASDAAFYGTINQLFPNQRLIEDENDFIRMIQNVSGFEDVDTIDDFFSILQGMPGFAGVNTIGEFLDKVGDYEGFDSFEDMMSGMQIANLGGIFSNVRSPEDLVATFKKIPGFESVKDMDGVIDLLNNRSAFNGITDFNSLATALASYPEAKNISNGSSFNSFLNNYDQFVDKINDYSSFGNVTSVPEFLSVVNGYSGFENVESIGEFISVLKKKYPNLFPSGDTLGNIIPKLGEVNQLFQNLGGN